MTNGLSLEELMKEGTYPEEYAEGENWKILHGDTLKLVKAFQPGIFDAVITDPPYRPVEQSRMKEIVLQTRNTAV